VHFGGRSVVVIHRGALSSPPQTDEPAGRPAVWSLGNLQRRDCAPFEPQADAWLSTLLDKDDVNRRALNTRENQRYLHLHIVEIRESQADIPKNGSSRGQFYPQTQILVTVRSFLHCFLKKEISSVSELPILFAYVFAILLIFVRSSQASGGSKEVPSHNDSSSLSESGNNSSRRINSSFSDCGHQVVCTTTLFWGTGGVITGLAFRSMPELDAELPIKPFALRIEVLVEDDIIAKLVIRLVQPKEFGSNLQRSKICVARLCLLLSCCHLQSCEGCWALGNGGLYSERVLTGWGEWGRFLPCC